MKKIALAVLLLVPSLAFVCNCPIQAVCPEDGGKGGLTGQHFVAGHHFCDYSHLHTDSHGVYTYRFSVECDK